MPLAIYRTSTNFFQKTWLPSLRGVRAYNDDTRSQSLTTSIQLMSRYHEWAYNRLYTVVDIIPESAYRKDMRLFFKSVHGTLNHLFIADSLWFSRFQQSVFPFKGLDEERYTDRTELKQALLLQAATWADFVPKISEEQAQGVLTYHNSRGVASTVPYLATLQHIFNHGTHHRGQISAAITGLGFETPVMDLVYFPKEKTHLVTTPLTLRK